NSSVTASAHSILKITWLKRRFQYDILLSITCRLISEWQMAAARRYSFLLPRDSGKTGKTANPQSARRNKL
ncbi:hypothetical protein, partial [Otoolea muris]|uniref:hypothetical protein n=1 Tax=Otoolea muris TaxID=2941515 RepID=UPI00203DBDB5